MSEYQPTLFDTFHNTIGLKDPELEKREMRAEAQGRRILQFFRDHPDKAFTPYQVMEALGYGPFQLQSVRRSLTNLTQCSERYLRITGVKVMERSGDLNNQWCLNPIVPQDSFTMTLEK